MGCRAGGHGWDGRGGGEDHEIDRGKVGEGLGGARPHPAAQTKGKESAHRECHALKKRPHAYHWFGPWRCRQGRGELNPTRYGCGPQ
jgi:hypothetical protein